MRKFSFLSTALLFSFLNCFSQPFTLDPSFGIGGKVYTNLVDINKADEIANAVAIQADDKIVIAGTTKTPAAIIRYNADGSLDNSFDHDGMAFCFGFTFNAIAIQGDGKIIVAGTSNGDFAVLRFNADGSPDNSFDGDGRLTTSIAAGTDIASCLALQSDGKIIVAGYSHNGSNNDFAMARYNINGSPDNSFDIDGKLYLAIGSSNENISSIAIQNDGKILVAGNSYNGSTYDFALARFHADGSPDNSFDGDGKLTTDINSPDENIKSIAIESDGKIIAAGLSGSNMNFQNLVFCHYNPDGSLDNTFDGDGKLTITNSFLYQIYSMVIQSDGKIMIAGTDYSPSYFDFALARLNADGSLDNSFDGDGKLMTAIGPGYDRVNAIAIQSDGKIVAAGRSETTGGIWEDFALARYNTDGSLDNSFASDGKVTTNISSSDDHARCMAVQSDGKVIVAGYSFTVVTNDDIRAKRFTLARYNTDGSLDNSFGVNGRVLTHFGGPENYAAAIAIQSDGKIVIAGTNLAGDYDFALVRYNTDGSLDNTFDGDGKVTPSLSNRQDGASALVIQSDGKIIAGGYSRNSSNTKNYFAVARFNADGSLDNSFDGDGKFYLSIGPGTSNDVITSMAVQNDGKILLSGYSHNGNDYDFAVVRLNTNGSLDNSFDVDGIVTTDMGSLNNYASCIVIQTDGKIVAGGNKNTGTVNDFAIVRYNSDGSLDNSFDGDAIVITDINSQDDVLTSLFVQNNGKIIAGGYSNNGSNNDFALVRYNANGSLDNTFDSDGKAIYDLETGSTEMCFAIQLRANRIYLAGDISAAGRSDFALMAVLNDILQSPLPLQLLDFSGKLPGEDALLRWKTENEINASKFIVERSTDGRNYIVVGSVNSANIAGTNYYNFTDYSVKSLGASILYYRLKQTDIDGRFTYSRIVALPVDKNRSFVLFYPNPVINEANLAISVNRRQQVQVRIIDNTGRIVKQQQFNLPAGSTSLAMDVTNLASGMYYMEIKGESINYKNQFVK